MRKFLVGGAFVLLVGIVTLAQEEKPPYLNPALPVEKRVDDLLSRMTVEEKVWQLRSEIREAMADSLAESGVGGLGPVLRGYSPKDGAIKANELQKKALSTRLKIPIIIHDEALHGIVAKGGTSFPQAIGLASTFNPELMEKVAIAIGKETRARGIQQVLSPTMNIARDARCGRVEETYGEDPYLASRMAVAFIKGVQSQKVICTAKHYAGNFVGDGGRDSNAIHFSERLLREIYFPAFEASVKEADVWSIMAAYNSLDGIPCSSNKWLLTDVLRKEWGFRGFVVSDYFSVVMIKEYHKVAATREETAKLALDAGLEVELPNIDIYGDPLMEAAKNGMISETTLNEAVRRVLRLKFEIGLFENPFVDPDDAAKINDCKEHRQLALETARQSIVLLRNEGNILPLDINKIKSIAVIGPNADAEKLGGYSGFGMEVVTPLEGIKNKVGDKIEINYAKGCDLVSTLSFIPPGNLIPPDADDDEHGLKGEYFNNTDLSGEPAFTRTDRFIDFNWGEGSPARRIKSDKFSARWTGKLAPTTTGSYKLGVTTDDGVRLWLDGKLLIDKWTDRAPTSDEADVTLEAGKKYDIKIEYYENSGGAVARLGWSLSSTTNEDIKAAVAAAKESDVAIIVAGILEAEGGDRAKINLPSLQEDLIKHVADTGKPTIVVLVAGSSVTMTDWLSKTKAILETWYPGEEGGNAIADVLFGDYNPGGKIVITFPQYIGQVPLYYNFKPTGRGYDYIEMSGKPLFPFGYGLSYTKFEYSNIKVSPDKFTTPGDVKVSVDVQNVGSRKGDEVVQLYIHDSVASVSRPVKELKGFKRITLEPNEKESVTFTLTPDQLSILDQKLKKVIEPGDWSIMLGSSSDDIRQRAKLTYEQK
ncbi:glycoside hydrolase family 3 C-terminal domain-containing protein [Candidatus Peregrinibacteria bacterium]|nr:glycoside hydrolase family 3 C-terminal domain-containing protein [Candidatus Peregrinibacteria bacterium]